MILKKFLPHRQHILYKRTLRYSCY